MRASSFMALRFSCCCVLAATAVHAQQWVDIPARETARIDDELLLSQYPQGKKWHGLSVMRVTGNGYCKNWMHREEDFIVTNSYGYQAEVLDNRLGELTLKVEVLSASREKVATRLSVKLRDLDEATPIFAVLLPYVETALELDPLVKRGWQLVKSFEDFVDPDLEKTLTKLAELGLLVGGQQPAESIIEPSIFEGCSFKLRYVNGLGVTKVEQIAGKRLKLDEVRRWGLSSYPLIDHYIFPSLKYKPGDKWSIDAGRATKLMALVDVESEGAIEVQYEKDSRIDGVNVRELDMVAGALEVSETSQGRVSTFDITITSGAIQMDTKSALVRLAHGKCDVDYRQISSDHWFFNTELSSELDVQFRYESKLVVAADK